MNRQTVRYVWLGSTVLLLVLSVLSASVWADWGRDGNIRAAGTNRAYPVTSLQSSWGGLGRRFYLTSEAVYDGSEALDACDAGFHMASIWEISDVSNLVYDTTLGVTGDDSGFGPPSYMSGWVRTGYYAASGDHAPGIGNCYVWTSNNVDYFGSVVLLSANWYGDAKINGTEWTSMTLQCNTNRRVWCVEDYTPSWNVGSYYLTQSNYDGASALTACTNGYHMASIWEILDPSNLVYDTNLGLVQADSGQGPPTYQYAHGWVRTGYHTDYVAATPGLANCNSWSSNSADDQGTFVDIRSDWTVERDVGVWEAVTGQCNVPRSVWCVRPPLRIYLPVVMKGF